MTSSPQLPTHLSKQAPRMNIYEKPADEKDYIVACGEILVKHGMKADVELAYITNPSINNALGKVAAFQRWALDRYWRDQLLLLENTSSPKIDTFEVSQYLAIGGDNEIWLQVFEEYVVPFLTAYKLPKPLPDFF